MLGIRKTIYKLSQLLEFYFLCKKHNSKIDNYKRIARTFNKEFFIDQKKSKKQILVEGFLINYGINYLYRVVLLSKTLKEQKGGEIKFIFNGQLNSIWKDEILFLRRIGVKKIIFTSWNYKEHHSHIYKKMSRNIWSNLKEPEDILKIKIEDLFIGDLVYDDILKNEKLVTIDKLEFKYKKYIDDACKFYLDYTEVFKKNKIDYYITTHTSYLQFGMISRIALGFGAIVFETTDLHAAVFKDKKELPTYHTGNRKLIYEYKLELDKNINNRNSLIEKYSRHLNLRLNSELSQIDVKLAYENKVTYSKEELLNNFKCKNDNKINIFIVAHVFKDSPHISENLIFKDYYTWLKETIIFLNDYSDKYNCFVKAHPSSKLYGEYDLINEMINKNGLNNIFLLDEKFSPKSYLSCADLIITCQGTVGIEFSCFGIPILTAGAAFYTNFGFTIDSNSKDEYFQYLKNLEQIKRLNHEQIMMAKYIYAIYNEFIVSENNIISLDVLNKVWGYKGEPDNDTAIELLRQNVEKHNVKSHPMYEKFIELLYLFKIQ